MVGSQDWLRGLVNEDGFFKPCEKCSYKGSGGRECVVNFFDVDEPRGACSLCLRSEHRVLQIRRSSYHDVVKTSDLARVTDVSGLQNYLINSSKVCFIRCRPQPKVPKGASGVSTCVVCDRSLQDPTSYCSIQCKLEAESAVAAGPSGSTYCHYDVSPARSSYAEQTAPSTPSRQEGSHAKRAQLLFPPLGEHSSAKRRKMKHPQRAPSY